MCLFVSILVNNQLIMINGMGKNNWKFNLPYTVISLTYWANIYAIIFMKVF